MTLIDHAPPDAGHRPGPRVSVVIPVGCSADELARTLEQIPAYVYEVILLDGWATDGAIAAARAIRPDLRVVPALDPDGGSSLRTAFAVAGGDCVVTMRADGSADPAELARFVGALAEGGATWPRAA